MAAHCKGHTLQYLRAWRRALCRTPVAGWVGILLSICVMTFHRVLPALILHDCPSTPAVGCCRRRCCRQPLYWQQRAAVGAAAGSPAPLLPCASGCLRPQRCCSALPVRLQAAALALLLHCQRKPQRCCLLLCHWHRACACPLAAAAAARCSSGSPGGCRACSAGPTRVRGRAAAGFAVARRPVGAGTC